MILPMPTQLTGMMPPAPRTTTPQSASNIIMSSGAPSMEMDTPSAAYVYIKVTMTVRDYSAMQGAP